MIKFLLKLQLLLLLLLLMALFSFRSIEDQEAKFKALFIYKFIDYIEWPAASGSVTVGVLGSPDVLDEMKAFAANKPEISVEEVKSSADLSKVDVLYAPSAKSTSARAILASVGSQAILVITDEKETVGKTSDIGFFLNDGKLRFAISQKTIESKKMLPSSKLLSLGEKI